MAKSNFLKNISNKVSDFASAGNKMSLKKFEIKLGIRHQELGLPWDQPVPEELWEKVAEYCDNDVIATEAVFDYWTARQILADLAEMTVNDTTNSLTTKIIFGGDKEPQGEFCYRDLSKPVHDLDEDLYLFLSECCAHHFPRYEFKKGVSTYRGEEVGEGGYVYAKPGMYARTMGYSNKALDHCLGKAIFGNINKKEDEENGEE